MPKSKRSGPALKVLQTAQTSFLSKLSGLHVNDFSQTTWEDARQGILDTEARMAARGCLRNTRRLMPLFEGLHHYSKVIEVLCNAVPFMPFVWAPIKFIVNVTCENVKAFDKIIGQYARIGESLIRFKMLQAAFSNYPEFQQIVAVFYSDILEFNGEAYKFVTRSAWELFFLTSWGRFERRFESIMESLKAHEMLLDKTANALNITEARQQREALSLERAEKLVLVTKEEKLRHASLYQEISTWLKVDDTEQALVFDSITQEVSKYPGTHDWIVQHDKIRSWLKDDSNGGFLWLQGSPGSGKTAIANRIVAFLQKVPDSVVVRHFCDPLTPTSASYDAILRSLLFQLVRANEDLVAYIHSLKTSQFLQKTVAPEALEDVIKKISGAVPRDPTKNHTIHIVIDGLDVCEHDALKRLFRLLKQLIASLVASTCFYKVLIVSRRTDVLRKIMGKSPNMSLNDEAKHVTDGIEKYAQKRFESMSSQLHELGVDEGRVKELSKQLATKAEGMFLWARLVLNYISSNLIYHGNEIENAIKVLPKELEQFYEKILLQTISNFDKQSIERLTSMLGWIVYAKRPLKKIELQSAITFSSGDSEQEDVVPSFVLSLCSQLVEERPDSTLVLIHSSVKEYLKSPTTLLRVSEQDALREHGIASMACLLSATRCFGSGEVSERQQQKFVLSGLHAFQLYAQEHWVDYILAIYPLSTAMPDNTLDELLRELCSRLHHMHQGELTTRNEITNDVGPLDKDPLASIRHLQALHWAGTAILKARSRGHQALDDRVSSPDPESPLEKVVFQYQAIVRDLLSEQYFAGISLEKLANFRDTHKGFAYTCRLGGCRRQAAGFETEKLRNQHEDAHRSFLKCEATGCQYPPFSSARTLQRHVRNIHAAKRQYRPIRSVRQSKLPHDIGNTPFNWGKGSLRTGPLSPAMLPGVEETPVNTESPYPSSMYLDGNLPNLSQKPFSADFGAGSALNTMAYSDGRHQTTRPVYSHDSPVNLHELLQHMEQRIDWRTPGNKRDIQLPSPSFNTTSPTFFQQADASSPYDYYDFEDPDLNFGAVMNGNVASHPASLGHETPPFANIGQEPTAFINSNPLSSTSMEASGLVSPSLTPMPIDQTLMPPIEATSTYQILQSSSWDTKEAINFPLLLQSFGSDWTAMAAHMKSKSATMLMKYYELHRKPEWKAAVAYADERKSKGDALPSPPVLWFAQGRDK